MKKIRVLIDGSWLAANRGVLARKLGRELLIDYAALPQVLVTEALRGLGLSSPAGVETCFFSSSPTNYAPADEALVARKLAFFALLKEQCGYHMEVFPLDIKGHRVAKEARNGFVPHEKMVDTAMASSLVVGALENSFDIAVCVCGDKDFLPAIAIARSHGKRVVIASITGSCAREYASRGAVDAGIVWLDGLLESIERTSLRSCCSGFHPTGLSLEFRAPAALSPQEACFCPLCANLAAVLRARAEASLGAPAVITAAGSVPLVGTVTKVVRERGFGFVTAQDNRCFYFHVTDTAGPWSAMRCGLSVFFEVKAAPTPEKAGKCARLWPAFGAA